MSLKDRVEQALNEENRPISWLASELDRTAEGLKLSLEKETIKYSDLRKLCAVLKRPITYFFEDETTKEMYIPQNNTLILAEPQQAYLLNVDSLKRHITLLESTIEDKNKIIALLSKE